MTCNKKQFNLSLAIILLFRTIPTIPRSNIFTRRVYGLDLYYRCKLEYKHGYPDRLVHLKLESLELHRLYNDIIMVYKIVHKLTSLNDDVLLSDHNANYKYHVLTRGHTLKLKKLILDLMWLEIIFVIKWYLHGMDCQIMLLLLLHLHVLFKKYLRTIDCSSYIKFDRNLYKHHIIIYNILHIVEYNHYYYNCLFM